MHYYIVDKQPTKFGANRLAGFAFLVLFLALVSKIWVPYSIAAFNATAIRFLPPDWSEAYINATLPDTAKADTGDRIVIDTRELKINAPIVDGVGPADLLKGVGHDPSSSLPGQQGRVILSGHRFWPDPSPWATVFFSLDKLKIGDLITVHFNGQTYRYKVNETWDVPRDEAHPKLSPTTQSVLTIYTCGPTAYSARHRLGFNAVLDESERKTESPKVIETLREGVL